MWRGDPVSILEPQAPPPLNAEQQEAVASLSEKFGSTGNAVKALIETTLQGNGDASIAKRFRLTCCVLEQYSEYHVGMPCYFDCVRAWASSPAIVGTDEALCFSAIDAAAGLDGVRGGVRGGAPPVLGGRDALSEEVDAELAMRDEYAILLEAEMDRMSGGIVRRTDLSSRKRQLFFHLLSAVDDGGDPLHMLHMMQADARSEEEAEGGPSEPPMGEQAPTHTSAVERRGHEAHTAIIRIGATVLLHGLVARPELNGARGTVVKALDPRSGRVGVRLDEGGSTIALKPSNLTDARQQKFGMGAET